jgi:hypothetical protein
MHNNKSTMAKQNTSFAVISTAMRIRRYSAVRIVQYGRSMATLDATICRHWASICPVSPLRMPWPSILAQKIELRCCETAVLKLAFKRHKTDPLLSSSKRQASNATFQAEELSYLSSHQALTTDKNLKLLITNEAHYYVDAHKRP